MQNVLIFLKHLRFNDYVTITLPSVFSYLSFLKEIIPPEFIPIYFQLIIGLIFSVIIAIGLYSSNKTQYKKNIVEVLATGYFSNFTNPFTNLLKGNTPIRFEFPDHSMEEILPQNITLLLELPPSLKTLEKFDSWVKENTKILYVRHQFIKEPYWVRGKYDDQTKELKIYEIPRPLYALNRYMPIEFSHDNKEETSKKIYPLFNEMMLNLKSQEEGKIPKNVIFDELDETKKYEVPLPK